LVSPSSSPRPPMGTRFERFKELTEARRVTPARTSVGRSTGFSIRGWISPRSGQGWGRAAGRRRYPPRYDRRIRCRSVCVRR
jgi:hypothetical protein